MGTTIFDFLTESFLFDDANREDCYASVAEADLLDELARYRQHVLANLPALRQEIALTMSRLKVFGARYSLSIDKLKQSALYLDQVVLSDPLFAQSRESSSASDRVVRFLGVPNNREVDRRGLADAASKMKALTPMVAADYVKFFPVSYYFEPDEEIPLVHSDTGFADALPTHILSKYQENADVNSLRKTDRGLIIENSLQRGRHICVKFRGDGEMVCYSLLQNEVLDVDSVARKIEFRATLPDGPPSVEEFEAWVNQSVNQAAAAHFETLLKELALSDVLGASYLSGSDFTHSLVAANDAARSVEHHTADCVLNLDLPYFEDIACHRLMEVRNNDGEVFDVFRNELEGQLRELRTETDPDVRKKKAENVAHEMNVVQIGEIDRKIRSLKKGALVDATIAVGSLVAAVVGSDLSIVGTGLAVDRLSRWASHRSEIRDKPAYFLWKARSGDRHRPRNRPRTAKPRGRG